MKTVKVVTSQVKVSSVALKTNPLSTIHKVTIPENLGRSKICSRQRSIFFYYYFSRKISLAISCELSAWQTFHMKCHNLFSVINNNNFILKVLSTAVVMDPLRVYVLRKWGHSFL